MATLFTSDLHFYHKNIVKFTERKKFTTADDHDEWLIDLWNKQVTSQDLVYHLGDFSFNHSKAKDILHRLNGSIVMVLGNHDMSDDRYKGHLEADNVVGVTQYKKIKINGTDTILFHYPIASWHNQARGSWHLHGHSHGNYDETGKLLDVGLDNAYSVLGEHRFFTEQEVIKHMGEQTYSVIDSHRRLEVP